MNAPAAFNVADLFEAVADCCGDRSALVAGRDRLTYRALDETAAQWATQFSDLGVGRGDRVALMLRNSAPHVAALLGAFKLRAVPFNVNLHYTPEEIRHLLTDADPTLVVCEDTATATVRAATDLLPRGGTTPTPPVHPLGRITGGLARLSPLPRRHDRRADDLYLLYTGGTTGLPKGVEWRQDDLFFAALGGDQHLGSPLTEPADVTRTLGAHGTRMLVACPLMHGTAQWVTLGTLLSGGTVVLFTDDTFDAVALLDLAEREEVAQLVLVGDAFAVPLADALDRQPGHWNLDRLVAVASGGAALAPGTAARLLHHLDGAVVVDGYGTSETGGQARRVHLAGMPDRAPGFVPGPDTTLVASDGTTVDRRSTALGRIGRTGRLPLRYRNDPERSADTFRTIDGVRWALTGDLGRWMPDGTIELVGRGERTVNSGGEKVDALEVEGVVRDHPAVADAMVVGIPDPRFGEVVGLLVRLAPGASLSAEQLARFCRMSLARFKLPRRVLVVADLPRTPAGKPDYRAAVAQLTATAQMDADAHVTGHETPG